ncbi:MAG: single-stranded DNA-binding protein [Fretibacterium sp.]|nr:single-stranded DNA-binding protein [Fretibacterium sp.]
MKDRVKQQQEAVEQLNRGLESLQLGGAATCVYNPLIYARSVFDAYLARYGATRKRVVFLGMNPGPWGMAQTGVPFGEVNVVRDWLQLSAPIGRPKLEHPQYPIHGLGCKRSEVSGRRLWGLFRKRFGNPKSFFEKHFVVNYCPLLFIADSPRKNGTMGGRNLTPDKLPAEVRHPLYALCNRHLTDVIEALEPTHIVGIGAFAEARAREAMGEGLQISRVLHPSPASPQSNRDWEGTATRQLIEQGVWPQESLKEQTDIG